MALDAGGEGNGLCGSARAAAPLWAGTCKAF